MKQWALPGLICIGDAAHAMSPVGGVGINLAIGDAIATSIILGPALRERRLNTRLVRRVQQRREFAVRVTQSVQVLAHRRFLAPTIARKDAASLEPIKAALRRLGFLRFVIAQGVGVGVRPEFPNRSA